MKAINTLYNNNYFRSRLEAKWAVFFEALKIPYKYEPEGFESETGDRYLPDFYLPETYLRNRTKGVYIEIKPESYLQDNIRQSEWFTRNLCLFKGLPHLSIWDSVEGYGGFELVCNAKPFWDNCMMFWICDSCHTTKIEFWEGNYDNCPACKEGNCNEARLLAAATESIKKRFEHEFNTK